MSPDHSLPLKRFRSVSELRVQFICEYRLYLEKQHGKPEGEPMQRGLRLHEMASNTDQITQNGRNIVKYFLLLLIVIAGLAWVLG